MSEKKKKKKKKKKKNENAKNEEKEALSGPQWLSTVSAVAKVQHDPQWPWSLTGDTTLFSRQSTFSGVCVKSKSRIAAGTGAVAVRKAGLAGL